jgi:hypothetical protein
VSHIDEIEVDQRLTSGRSPSAHAGSRLSPLLTKSVVKVV